MHIGATLQHEINAKHYLRCISNCLEMVWHLSTLLCLRKTRKPWILSSLSPALHAMNLPILTCSYCMRKVGLWNFHQMEVTAGDGDSSASTTGSSAQAAGSASAATNESQAEQPACASPTPASAPCRMKLRSQDSSRSDQVSFKNVKVNLEIIYAWFPGKMSDF